MSPMITSGSRSIAPGDVLFGKGSGIWRDRLVLSAMGGFSCPYGIFSSSDCARLFEYKLDPGTCFLSTITPAEPVDYEPPQPTGAWKSYSTSADFGIGRERIRSLVETPYGYLMATNGASYPAHDLTSYSLPKATYTSKINLWVNPMEMESSMFWTLWPWSITSSVAKARMWTPLMPTLMAGSTFSTY